MVKSINKIRIVAGSAGGLWIEVPKNFKSRPTQDRIKQAIFSSLGNAVINATVLDLFAGTGNLGIEALSRGAASCTFVEQEPFYTKIIKKNLERCHLIGNVVTQSVEKFLENKDISSFSIIFLDPPYLKEKIDLAQYPMTKLLAEKTASSTFLVWEHAMMNEWKSHPDFETLKQSRHGSTSVLFLRKK